MKNTSLLYIIPKIDDFKNLDLLSKDKDKEDFINIFFQKNIFNKNYKEIINLFNKFNLYKYLPKTIYLKQKNIYFLEKMEN